MTSIYYEVKKVNQNFNDRQPRPTSPELNLDVRRDFATDNNTNRDVAMLVRSYSGGVGADGIGSRLAFHAETETEGTIYTAGRVGAILTDATAGTEDGALIFETVLNGTAYERVRILANGNVGIGTASPDYPLEIRSTGNTGLRTDIDTAGGVAMSISSVGNFEIDAAGVAGGRFIVNESGLVGIGTATPGYKLEVNGNICEADGVLSACASDIRLKENIKPINNATDVLMKLNPVEFTWKDTGEKGTGLIAQDIEKVYPEWIRDKEDGYIAYDDPGFKYILIKAIQELKAENGALEARIEALEAKLNIGQ